MENEIPCHVQTGPGQYMDVIRCAYRNLVKQAMRPLPSVWAFQGARRTVRVATATVAI